MHASEKVAKRKTKIVIIEDHPIVRRGILLLLEQEKDLVAAGEADTAVEAMRLIDKVKPDFALVDISLRGASGIELTKNILARYPNIFVLILSMHDESVYLERSLRAGAKGYLTKQETTDHVVTAIRKILGGELYVSDRWRDKLLSTFVGRGKAMEGTTIGSLSDRETEVLQLIGQGYATGRIAAELHVSVKTVESHYANIKNKLGLENLHELIQYAVKWCLSE